MTTSARARWRSYRNAFHLLMCTLGAAPLVRLLFSGDGRSADANFARLQRLYDSAYDCYGDADDAVDWLTTRLSPLRAPPAYACTSDDEVGAYITLLKLARTVEDSGPELDAALERLCRMHTAAMSLHAGEPVAAAEWLGTDRAILGGDPPYTYADTDDRSQVVMDLIGRQQHGIFHKSEDES